MPGKDSHDSCSLSTDEGVPPAGPNPELVDQLVRNRFRGAFKVLAGATMVAFLFCGFPSLMGAGWPGTGESVAAGWEFTHDVKLIIRQGAPELLGGALTLIALSVGAIVPAGLSAPEFYALHRVSRRLSTVTAFVLATLALVSLPVFDGDAGQLEAWVGVPLIVVASATSVLLGESKLDKWVSASRKTRYIELLRGRRSQILNHPESLGGRWSLFIKSIMKRGSVRYLTALGVFSGVRARTRSRVPDSAKFWIWVTSPSAYIPFLVLAAQGSAEAAIMVGVCAAGSLAGNMLALLLTVQSRKEFALVVENPGHATCSFMNMVIASVSLVFGLALTVLAGSFAESGGWTIAILAAFASWVYLIVYMVDGKLVKRMLVRSLTREIRRAKREWDLLQADLSDAG